MLRNPRRSARILPTQKRQSSGASGPRRRPFGAHCVSRVAINPSKAVSLWGRVPASTLGEGTSVKALLKLLYDRLLLALVSLLIIVLITLNSLLKRVRC